MGKALMPKLLVSGTILWLLAFQAVADTSCEESVETVLTSIFASSRSVNTIASDFKQIREVSLLADPIVSKGKFYFQKKDSLRWEVITPDPRGFWVKGAKGKRWKKDETHAQTFAVSAVPFVELFTRQVFAWANGNAAPLTSHYRMTIVEQSPLVLKLTPRKADEKQYLQYVQLIFADNLDHIRDVLIRLMDGDQTKIRFFNTVLNKPLPNTLFD